MTYGARPGQGATAAAGRPARAVPASGRSGRGLLGGLLGDGGFADAPELEGLGGWARVRRVLLAPGARRWYPGALISQAFAIGFMVVPVLVGLPAPESWLWAAGIVLYGLLFTLSFPISTALPRGWRAAPPAVLLLLTAPFLAGLGSGATGLWVYVAVSAALCLGGGGRATIAVLGLAAGALLVNVLMALVEPSDVPPWTMPLVTASVGMLMAAFGRNLRTLRELRRTQEELAQVAVEEERNRVARDMHDILGHSLSAIALKADLAAKLADRDPAAAAAEIHEVQTLARATLSDMRAVVSGYRQVRIASELASLRTLLPAAGITAHLPTTTDEVPERNRELFGWALREAGTNVIRHARATSCWVTLSPSRITVEDDGVGPAPQTADEPSGTGLHGLAERAADAGGALRIGRSPRGGFLLEVTA